MKQTKMKEEFQFYAIQSKECLNREAENVFVLATDLHK